MSTVPSETIVANTTERKIKQETSASQTQISKPDSIFLPVEELGHQYRLEEGGQMNPYFFRIQKNDRVSYLLGSVHTLPFEILHERCQEMIKTTHCLAVEHEDSGITSEGMRDILRSEDEPNWYQALPSLFQSLLQKASKSWLVKPEQLSFKEIGRIVEGSRHYELEQDMDNFVADYFRQNEKPVYSLDSDQIEDDALAVVYPGLTDIERSSEAIEGTKQLIKKRNLDIQEMEKAKRKLIGNQNELELSQHESDLIKAYNESIEASKSNIETYKRIIEGYKDLLISKVSDYQPRAEDEFYGYCQWYWQGMLELNQFGIKDEEEEEEFVSLGVRNLYWLPRILQLHQGERTLVVVVGALHLAGKYGLLNLLKESGFKIERMNSQGIFEDYGDYDPQGSLAERLVLQTRAYDTLRNQILGTPETSNSSNPLTWMQCVRNQMEWEQWKQKYTEERPNAEKNGYGPGALMLYKAPRNLF